MESFDEFIKDDMKATAIIEKIRRMTYDERLEDIFRHEKEVRGIDWLALAAEGETGLMKARRLADEYLTKLRADLGVTDADIPTFRLAVNDEVQVMPAWGINEKEALVWKNARGQDLADMVSFRLKIMQSLELTSSDTVYAQISLSIGVVAWLKKAYDAYTIARAAGFTSLSSAIQGIRAVTLNASKAFIATVVVAIIAEVLLYLMEKKAVVYTVLINMTDDDLIMNDLGIVNGKQLVQFVDPLELKQRNALNKRVGIELKAGEIEYSYWVGLFAASKRDMALIGSLGAYSFTPCNSFPHSVYVGWEIPLTFFGGNNRCLVSALNEGSCKRFADKTSRDGTLESASESNIATVTARMHSGSGSEGYMSVIFEKKSNID